MLEETISKSFSQRFCRQILGDDGLKNITNWRNLTIFGVFQSMLALISDIISVSGTDFANIPKFGIAFAVAFFVIFGVIAAATREHIRRRSFLISVIFVVSAIVLAGIVFVQSSFANGGSLIATTIPAVKDLQETLFLDVRTIGQNVNSMIAYQHDEGRRADEHHTEYMAGQKRLERLIIDAASSGASAVTAVDEIRSLLRPGNPEIDSIPAEQLPSLVQHIIKDLQKPARQFEYLSSGHKNALELTKHLIESLRFVDAAKTLDAAIEDSETESRSRTKALAALLAERGRVAGLQLRFRDAAAFYKKAAEATEFDSTLAWSYLMEAAGALYTHGSAFGDVGTANEMIEICTSALKLAPRTNAPLAWATTQNELGLAYLLQGFRDATKTAPAEAAQLAFTEALKERTHESAAFEWAETKNNLGIALLLLGERENESEALNRALAAFGDALRVFTIDKFPKRWATIQINLGETLRVLGERESNTAYIAKSVSIFEEALMINTHAHAPQEWATTQVNLGNALSALGRLEGEISTLDRAIASYADALTELTQERSPWLWAAVKYNMGNALFELGLREKGTQSLENAVSVYNAALMVRTRKESAHEWEATQRNLGVTLAVLGLRESDILTLKKAVSAFINLVDAIPRKQAPARWAKAQADLGNVLLSIAEYESGTSSLKQAIAAFSDASKEGTREHDPLLWARNQAALGRAFLMLSVRENRTNSLDRAAAAFAAALKEYNAKTNSAERDIVQANLEFTAKLRAHRRDK
jgi:tetratricopeptide (TPR) repeat protein